MRQWTVEYGTLWAWEPAGGLPVARPARVPAEFVELGVEDSIELAAAMALPAPDPVQERLASGRRCFGLRIAGQLASYGWATRGREHVGELERVFRLHDDEVYIWDCATMPAWRGHGCYSALLNQIIYRLQQERVGRIWIGASRLNQPSVRGMANAGFGHVVDCTYRRVSRLTTMRLHGRSARTPLAAAAYRILIAEHERRIGALAFGILPTK
jgi:ribosomal protein S18 acetylase RimI-like enzyme